MQDESIEVIKDEQYILIEDKHFWRIDICWNIKGKLANILFLLIINLDKYSLNKIIDLLK